MTLIQNWNRRSFCQDLRDAKGKKHICRALLDPGSQSHFITEELIRRLHLPCKRESTLINGIMRKETEVERSTRVLIEALHCDFKAELDCLVLPQITERLPQVHIDRNLLSVPRNCKLADPEFNKPGKIDLKLERVFSEICWSILR